MYPLTILRELNGDARRRLTANGIVMLKQLIEQNVADLRMQTGISDDTVASLIDDARTILMGT